MRVNEDKGSDEENSKDEIVEETVKDISEEEDTEEYAHAGFLISDNFDRNDLASDTEAESLILTPELEIENIDGSTTLKSEEEYAEMIPEGA